MKLDHAQLDVIPADGFAGLYFSNTAQNPNFKPTIDLTGILFSRLEDGAFNTLYNRLDFVTHITIGQECFFFFLKMNKGENWFAFLF